MAIIRTGKITTLDIQEFIGLSTDPKPMDCDAGSTFEELDTRNKFKWDGNTWWAAHNNITDFTFQNAVTVPGNGNALTITHPITLDIEVYGTATSSTVVFEVLGKSGNWYVTQGIRLSDYTLATSTTTKGELWEFEVPSTVVSLRMRVASIVGGNLNVVGKIMDDND